MSDSVLIDVVGVTVRVRVDGAERLRTILANVMVDEPADAAVGPVDADADDVEGVLAAAVRAAIDSSPDLLLHAGAVAADGQVTVFPGASGQGKSTLTAACLRHGFGYVTDELVAVDLDTQQVNGLARPLFLTAWSVRAMGLPDDDAADDLVGKPAGKRAVPPEQLGSATTPGRHPVANVVIARRGAQASALTPIAAGTVFEEILTASFNHYVHAERAWTAAVALANSARGWRLDVADPASAAELVAGLTSSAGAGAGGSPG
ncbi:hypothetical protein [Haloactinopolyspora sp.]|uniref:hypothetical protein n=1 Tax=Haloactinopolyspora sp. TaxID=1966353 RepID=UPI002608E243|nr:hypothetical protein [Haloactinopolyspora sp.]